jgi:hypothetical protein
MGAEHGRKKHSLQPEVAQKPGQVLLLLLVLNLLLSATLPSPLTWSQ